MIKQLSIKGIDKEDIQFGTMHYDMIILTYEKAVELFKGNVTKLVQGGNEYLFTISNKGIVSREDIIEFNSLLDEFMDMIDGMASTREENWGETHITYQLLEPNGNRMEVTRKNSIERLGKGDIKFKRLDFNLYGVVGENHIEQKAKEMFGDQLKGRWVDKEDDYSYHIQLGGVWFTLLKREVDAFNSQLNEFIIYLETEATKEYNSISYKEVIIDGVFEEDKVLRTLNVK